MSSLIRTENLSHVYANRAQSQSIAALNEVTLALARGEYLAIVGANGSGKSTLARHFNALLLPTEGNVWVNASNTRDVSNLRAIRQAVAMVFQNPENQFVATVAEEDVAFGPENFGVPPRELHARVDAALNAVGLGSLRARAPHMLSAGQQQRLAIAGALALQPVALLLDEATAMLDPRGKESVMNLAAQLHRQGLTLVAITQAMEEAAQAERIVVMQSGRVVLDGAPREIFAEAARLRALDLELPPFAEIAAQLSQQVSDFPHNILTLDELVAAIIARHSNHHARPFNAGDQARVNSLPPPPRGGGLGRGQHPIIETRALRHIYLRGTPRAVEALRGVDLEIYSGEIVGIIGASGSGKSTLLQHFNGLIRPGAGEGTVVVNGIDLSKPNADVRTLRQQVGLVFQFAERQLFERYVGDDIAFGPRQFHYSREEVRARVRRAMARVGLDFDEFKDRVTLTLSGGEKRRAALAGVLALEPRVLVLDEPTAGLDPRGRREFLAQLKEWRAKENLTSVIVSHHMDEIAEVCDRVYVLDEGRVAFSGSPRELFSRVEELASFGLNPPPALKLAQSLRARGVAIDANVLTIEEVVAAIAKFLTGGS